MATRPVFIPLPGRRSHDGRNNRGPLVETLDVELHWHGGFALSQKQKNVWELHQKAQELGIFPILEISTKSNEEVGRRLSAFNLKIEIEGSMKSLESAYQSAKVFSESGQHRFLIDADPYEAKKSIRRLGVGNIVKFRLFDRDFETEPKNAFYDWLYIRAISPHEDWIRRNVKYAAYSDIEFTPGKSINCQARAVAEFHALSLRGQALECARDFDQFRALLAMAQREGSL
jgi:hypothetical protein